MKLYRVVLEGRSFHITEDKLPFYQNIENCSIYEIVEKPIQVNNNQNINRTSLYIGKDKNET